MIIKIKLVCLLSVSLLLISSCESKKKQANIPNIIDVPVIKLNLEFIRFEKLIFDQQTPFDSTQIHTLRLTYGKFFDLWCVKLAGITPASRDPLSDADIATNLNQYRSDKYIRLVYADCDKKFSDISNLKSSFTESFKRYHLLFSGKNIPKIVTYISPFTSNVMAMDSVLGIGLHFYLGADYKYYPSLQLPQYMVRKFREEYILTDALKGWIDSEYTNDSLHRSFLNNLVYQGKILYALDLLTPDTDDTIKIGFSEKQLTWAIQNESEIWGFFIEHQLLYNNNPKTYMKFINDGNGTSGFPKDAPAQLGVYIGWQIVRSFMHQHPEIKLPQLFSIQDAQLLLSQSNYRPAKNS